ncbi:hypothetical protein BCEN4_740126 [Burkholderia cenocepacia]|nr:hypothetical protein BCEN4_740126 [Burkholderia cenocepacia]
MLFWRMFVKVLHDNTSSHKLV